MIIMKPTAAILALALLATPSAAQQNHDHGLPAASVEVSADHQMMAFMPDMLLKSAAELELTESQRSALEELQGTAMNAMHMSEAQALRAAACEALGTERPDWDAYGEALHGSAELMVSAHVGMMRAVTDARALLTPEQVALVLEQEPMGASTGMGASESLGMPHPMGEMSTMGQMSGTGMAPMMGMMGMCQPEAAGSHRH